MQGLPMDGETPQTRELGELEARYREAPTPELRQTLMHEMFLSHWPACRAPLLRAYEEDIDDHVRAAALTFLMGPYRSDLQTPPDPAIPERIVLLERAAADRGLLVRARAMEFLPYSPDRGRALVAMLRVLRRATRFAVEAKPFVAFCTAVPLGEDPTTRMLQQNLEREGLLEALRADADVEQDDVARLLDLSRVDSVGRNHPDHQTALAFLAGLIHEALARRALAAPTSLALPPDLAERTRPPLWKQALWLAGSLFGADAFYSSWQEMLQHAPQLSFFVVPLTVGTGLYLAVYLAVLHDASGAGRHVPVATRIASWVLFFAPFAWAAYHQSWHNLF